MPDNQVEKINPVLERMFEYLEYKDIKPTKADKDMQSGNGRLGKMRANNTTPKAPFIEKFLSVYPDVNRGWLEKGEGNMINTAPPTAPRIEAKPLRLADPYGLEATGAKFYTLADGSEVMQIKVVPKKAFGSYLRGHSDPEFYEGFDTITIPVDRLHKGTYLAFEMAGDSMVNIENETMARKSLWPGQKIIGRDLKRELWKYKLHIHSNEAWIIVHRTMGIVVKEIIAQDLDTGMITLHSWNPDKKEYPDYEVHLDDVEQLLNVVDPFGKMKPY